MDRIQKQRFWTRNGVKCVLLVHVRKCHCMCVVMVVCTLAQISDDVIGYFLAEHWAVLVHTSTMDRPPTEKVRH